MIFLEKFEEGNLAQSSAESSGVTCATDAPLQATRARSKSYPINQALTQIHRYDGSGLKSKKTGLKPFYYWLK